MSKQGSSKALATVTAIIDGTGSIGAAIGPFLAGALPEGDEGEDGPGKNHELDNIFYMLMAADIVSLFVSLPTNINRVFILKLVCR